MVAMVGVLVILLLAMLFLLLRAAGRFGQQPSADERMHHNGSAMREQGPPRATGLN
jgi:hypothetical protein